MNWKSQIRRSELIACALTLFLVVGCSNPRNCPKLHFGFLPDGIVIGERSSTAGMTLAHAVVQGIDEFERNVRIAPPSNSVWMRNCGNLRVYQLERNAKRLARDYPSFAKALPVLRERLENRPAQWPLRGPDLPFANAGKYVQAKLRYLDVPWGKAVMMLTQYSQEAHPPPPNNDWLLVWIQGLSHDAISGSGGYYVSARLRVTHPKLPDVDGAYANEKKVGIEAGERLLESFPDDSYSPPLGEFERMLCEMRVEAK